MIRDEMLTDIPLAVLARVSYERPSFISFRKAADLLERGALHEARATG